MVLEKNRSLSTLHEPTHGARGDQLDHLVKWLNLYPQLNRRHYLHLCLHSRPYPTFPSFDHEMDHSAFTGP